MLTIMENIVGPNLGPMSSEYPGKSKCTLLTCRRTMYELRSLSRELLMNVNKGESELTASEVRVISAKVGCDNKN